MGNTSPCTQILRPSRLRAHTNTPASTPTQLSGLHTHPNPRPSPEPTLRPSRQPKPRRPKPAGLHTNPTHNPERDGTVPGSRRRSSVALPRPPRGRPVPGVRPPSGLSGRPLPPERDKQCQMRSSTNRITNIVEVKSVPALLLASHERPVSGTRPPPPKQAMNKIELMMRTKNDDFAIFDCSSQTSTTLPHSDHRFRMNAKFGVQSGTSGLGLPQQCS